MRVLMGVIKDRNGTFYAQLRVPVSLRAAVARVLQNGKPSQTYLKKSLGTKDSREANVRAKPVLSEFDQTIARAKALLASAHAPLHQRSSLNPTEITRMAEHVYATTLAWDERFRVGGRDELRRLGLEVRAQDGRAGQSSLPPKYTYDSLPPHGWSREQLEDDREQLVDDMHAIQGALALGDISAVETQITLALDAFGITLAPGSPAYPQLGIAVLRSYVRALQAIEKRNAGEPIDTPKITLGPRGSSAAGGTLRDAFDGWQRQRARPPTTVNEARRSIELFVQMHGNLSVVEIKRSHVLAFREALQDVPRRRDGELLKASLPELQTWGRAHPSAPKIAPGTINKQLGAVQAIVAWAYANGLVPEDAPLSDPFRKMRVPKEDSERAPFVTAELKSLFNAPLFTGGAKPAGAKGDAGIWLPLMALFTGARQAELAGLTVADVFWETESGSYVLLITEQLRHGKRLKTKSSRRAIPLHPQLAALGFNALVEKRAREGVKAWLFPTVAPDQPRALAAWSKWFGRYLRRAVGVADTAKVFHSFRHGFKDAARAARVSQEVHDALTGHANVSAVSGGYGAKQMLQRFGIDVLKDAVTAINYAGLDLSKVRTGYPAPRPGNSSS